MNISGSVGSTGDLIRAPQPDWLPHDCAGAAAVLAAVTCTLLASAAVIPAAWAVNVIPNDGPAQAPAGGVSRGRHAGLADHPDRLGSAVVSATAAVWLNRTRAARRAASATST